MIPGFINHKKPIAACQVIDEEQTRIYDVKLLMQLTYSVFTETFVFFVKNQELSDLSVS